MWPRWIRALTTIWVAWDSKQRKTLDWFWVLVVLLLGPLLLPIYLTNRPLLKGEKRVGGFFWNLLISLENFSTWVVGLAAAAVFIENITTPHDPNVAEVKRAEIKAGSLAGIFIFIFLVGLEKLGFEHFRQHIEKKLTGS
ncbi:MAG: hypothetical protein KKB51_12815 [Candidatus Riflebacteria bacterium]|nr:hypothetical protein [Candidatus Riflebacteria bacterium]